MTSRTELPQRPSILATDLDGTLIPYPDEATHWDDLRTLEDHFANVPHELVFVTGRFFQSVMTAIAEFRLPRPGWIICDVGTSIFRLETTGNYIQLESYRLHLQQIIAQMPRENLQALLSKLPGLRLQEAEKQGPFKLSYYCHADSLAPQADAIQQVLSASQAPYSVISSVDPFNGDGLIDLLPLEVSKSFALHWWQRHNQADGEAILFAGDSGNDLAALTSGYKSILVGNAVPELSRKVETVHHARGWKDRLYLAKGHATEGVVEGCRWFNLLD